MVAMTVWAAPGSPPRTLEADHLVGLQQVRQRRRHVADLVVGGLGEPAEQSLVGRRRSRSFERRVLHTSSASTRSDVGEPDEPVEGELVGGGEGEDGVEAGEPVAAGQQLRERGAVDAGSLGELALVQPRATDRLAEAIGERRR